MKNKQKTGQVFKKTLLDNFQRAYLFTVRLLDHDGNEIMPKNESTTVVRTVDFTDPTLLKFTYLMIPEAIGKILSHNVSQIEVGCMERNGDVNHKTLFTNLHLRSVYFNTIFGHDNLKDTFVTISIDYNVLEYTIITANNEEFKFINKP
jgi:hypothetical protein